MKDPAKEIRVMVYNLIKVLGYSIYDHVPDGAEFPYVVLFQFNLLPDEDINETFRTGLTVTVSCFTNFPNGVGNSDDVDMMSNNILEILITKEFTDTTDNFSVDSVEFQSSDYTRENNESGFLIAKHTRIKYLLTEL